MKRFFIVGIIYFLSLINPLSANNIAFIDIKLLMQTSTAGLNISSKIKILEKQKIKLIENVGNDLKDKEKELVAKKNILSENDFKIEISKLKKEINEFNVMKNYENRDKKSFSLLYSVFLFELIDLLKVFSGSCRFFESIGRKKTSLCFCIFDYFFLNGFLSIKI